MIYGKSTIQREKRLPPIIPTPAAAVLIPLGPLLLQIHVEVPAEIAETIQLIQ